MNSTGYQDRSLFKITLKYPPSFLLKDDRAGSTSLDLNAFIIMGDKLWIGGAYRIGVKLYNKPYS